MRPLKKMSEGHLRVIEEAASSPCAVSFLTEVVQDLLEELSAQRTDTIEPMTESEAAEFEAVYGSDAEFIKRLRETHIKKDAEFRRYLAFRAVQQGETGNG